MSKDIISNNEKIFDTNYTTFENLYFTKDFFKSFYNRVWNIIKRGKDDKVIWLMIKEYNIGYKKNDQHYMTLKDYVLLLVIAELLKLGMDNDFINKYIGIFRDKYVNRKDVNEKYKYLFEFYVYFAIKGIAVSVFIDNDLNVNTFENYISDRNIKYDGKTKIIIDLNRILSKIFQREFIPNENFVRINDDEIELIRAIDSNLYKKDCIKINFSKNKMKNIIIEGKEFDLNKWKMIHDKIENGDIGKKKYKGKTQYIKIMENIQIY